MTSLLIKDTTREEREKIVADSLGNMSGGCDGCASSLVDMYDDYIEGRKELKDINMSFHTEYVVADEPVEKSRGCGY